MIRRLMLFLAAVLGVSGGRAAAQVCQDFVVDLAATVSTNPPQITLNWALRLATNITGQTLYRRLKGEANWSALATLATNTTSYTDSNVTAGVEYEYWLYRSLTTPYVYRADGYLSAGINVPFVENRGKVILIVDRTMAGPLAPEIAQLQQDLVGDGWTVIRHDVPRMSVDPADTNSAVWATRTAELDYVKTLIVSNYNADPPNVKAVYLLGRTPVPYSGNLAPDGHPDHVGAWPALGFYGDVNGSWTDSTVTSTNGSDRRNWNLPGDGKFDQSSLPSDVELQVGRLDMANMTKFPTSAVSETNLLRRYLRKVHEYRHCEGAYTNVARRGMMRDGFGYFYSSEPFASTAWGAIYSSLGRTSNVWDAIASGDWFIRPETNTYLFAYGNGGGSYESANTVGTSSDFGDKPSRAVFISLFGSYFGDWDRANVFLRAPLAGNGRGNSYGLTCFWSGRPAWHLHPMGMGETIGYAARLSQNNSGDYRYLGYSARGVHIGLMGDPTLRFYMFPPPQNLRGYSNNSLVRLLWSPATGVMGYHVFRADSPDGPFVRLTTNHLTTAFYTDTTVTPGSNYTYMVRCLRLETVPGGTFQNLSQGAFVTLTALASPSGAPRNPTSLRVAPVASNQIVLNWQDNSTDEEGFRIERRDDPASNFVAIATVSANTTNFTDSGPLPVNGIFYYRVFATNSVGDSASSNEAYADGWAGFLELPTTIVHVDKSAGSVLIPLDRYGGSNGAVAAICFTTNISAYAGTHYVNFSNVVTFADGISTQQMLAVTLLNTGQPQLPRSFRMVARQPSGGTSIARGTNTLVLIEDATATLQPPWQATILGAPTDYGPAVHAEGVLGSSIYGGGIDTADNIRFIHRLLTNDVLLTAKVEVPLPNQNSARYGLMMRTNLVSSGPMVLLWLPGDFSGAKLGNRPTDSAAVVYQPSTSNSNRAPYWLRLARIGQTFIGETSSNGTDWVTLASVTQTSPPACYWGFFHYSDPNIRDFQLARFSNIIVSTNVLPVAPTGLIATPTATNRVLLSWSDPAHNADAFFIERRTFGGAFSPIGQTASNETSYTDTTAAAATSYEYQIRATNHWGVSGSSATATATTFNAYQQWCSDNALPTDGSGEGAATACPAGDAIPNLMKFALGIHAHTNGYQGHLSCGTTNISGQTYLTLTYTRLEPAPPGVTYTVEVANDLVTADWTSLETVVVSSIVNGAWRTITVRDQYSVGDRPKRFIHLRITQ